MWRIPFRAIWHQLMYCYNRFMYFSNHTDCFSHIGWLCHYFAMDGKRNLRWIIMLLFLSPPLIFYSYQITFQGSTLLYFSYYVIQVMYLCITLFKMTVIRVTFGATRSLMDYFNAHVFHRDDPVCYHLRRKTYFITWKIFFFLLAYNATYILAYMATTRPTSSSVGIRVVEVNWYHVVLAEAVAAFSLLYNCIYGTSILIVSFLMHWFQTELEILSKAFALIFHDKPPYALRKESNTHRRILLQREEIRWTGIERRLVYCIGRHGEIVELIKLLRKIVEPIFFGLGFYIVTTISTLIFIMLKDSNLNFLAIAHTVAVIVEFYYYAHLVDDLDDKHHLIANALYYEQDWSTQLKHSPRFAKQHKSVKTMLLIVIMHSQRPFRFTCGGLYKMTVPAFTAMIETLYVAVTFMLRNIKINR